ncbi:MAG: BamA/TamA family outer membrane protein [Burkholderiaceae bacterium]|nr:BamA/TamA family outer membrane protein [Burkholderiaceae bacterium]
MSAWPCAASLTLSCVLCGCAALKPIAPDANAEPPPPQVLLTIAAPDEHKRLLETHLDLARLAIVAPGEALSDTELRRLEAAAPAQARGLLATQGYMNPDVTVQREASAPGELPRVRIEVAPGAKSRIERTDLDLQGPLAEAAASGDASARETLAGWRAAWRLPAGSDFSDSTWRDAKTAALARLRAAGYASANWSSTSAQVDADRASVHIVVRADSGPLYRTGALVIEGLERQDERSVRYLANFAEGTPATEALLLDYQERLQRAGLFERVSVTLAPDPASAAAATVTARLGELPLQQATAGVGISANNGPRVSLEHLHRRAFGERATLRNKIEIGRVRQAWDGELASHTLPGLYRNLVGGAVERLESDTDRVTALRVRFGRAYDSQRIERLAFVEVERALVRPFATTLQAAQANADTTAATVNFHGTWRDVDSVILPTLGQSLALQGAVGRVHGSSGGAVGNSGSGGFARAYGRLQAWRPLGGNWYGQARVELGQVFAPGAVKVPEPQRFRAGGDDSVRGYAYRSLSPNVGGVDVGGRVLATASVELARPISAKLPSVWWAAFIDAGRAAASWNDWRAAWGAGLGLRWRSPVGPLRADVAYGEEIRQWRLHLSVGIAF